MRSNQSLEPAPWLMTSSHHTLYEVRPRKDHRGVNLVSDALPFSRLWLSRMTPCRPREGFTAGHLML